MLFFYYYYFFYKFKKINIIGVGSKAPYYFWKSEAASWDNSQRGSKPNWKREVETKNTQQVVKHQERRDLSIIFLKEEFTGLFNRYCTKRGCWKNGENCRDVTLVSLDSKVLREEVPYKKDGGICRKFWKDPFPDSNQLFFGVLAL